MLITCPSCQAKYRVADDKVEGRSVAVRCGTCEAVITVGAGIGDGVSSQRQAPVRARSDSSHMFTLAELVGRATASQPQPDPKKGDANPKKDTSGVIDLNALARAAAERARKAQSEPPTEFAREARTADPAPSMARKVRFAGLFAAAAALAVVGGVAVTSGDEPNKPQPTRVAAAAPHATEIARTEVLASMPAGSPESATATLQTGKVGNTGKGRGPVASGARLAKVTNGGTDAATSKAPPPPPKPKAAADPCGCKGNLQCAIKCFK